MFLRLSRANIARPRAQLSVTRVSRAVSSMSRLAQAMAASEATSNASTVPAEIASIHVPTNPPTTPIDKEVPVQQSTAAPARELAEPVPPTNYNTTAAAGVADTLTTSAPAADLPPVGQNDEFWRKVPVWKDVSASEFLSYRWGIANTVQGGPKLLKFLNAVLPETVPYDGEGTRMQTRDELVKDVFDGVTAATMAIRMTPYILSRVDWENPRNDPIFRQFLPMKSVMLPDHPKLTLDSLHEEADSPVKGLVHRYPDKALFLPTSVCPTYCMFCTRSYAVGADTDTVTKASLKPTRKRWEEAFAYIESQPGLHDIVVSGGDSYYLMPEHLRLIGERLISIPNIRRFRFASKGLAVAPSRVIDGADGWVDALIDISNMAKKAGKSVALHTHFNHPNEISWVTALASQKLLEAGVMVRNQTVLLRGVNDDFQTMSTLIRKLADHNIFPYYVYLCDMVQKVEHLRTPLQTILDLEAQIRGSIAGFTMPQFVVDLPGGGGKRLACSYRSYDRTTGISTYMAPAVKGRDKENKVYEYYDPMDSLVDSGTADELPNLTLRPHMG